MSETHRTDDSNPDLPSAPASAAERLGRIRDDQAELPHESELSSTERQQLADQLFLDVLLTQAIQLETAAHREKLFSRVLQSIQQETSAPIVSSPHATDMKDGGHAEGKSADSPVMTHRDTNGTARIHSSRMWWSSLATLAAVVVLGLLFLSPQTGPRTALAAVNRSLQAASEDVDRQYEIHMVDTDRIVREAALPITLTVRGADRFVWEQPLPLGTLRIGSNGQEYWLVPNVGPVLVAAEGSRIERILSDKQLTTPFLALTTALEWMRMRYDLEMLPEEDVESLTHPGTQVRCERIHAIRQIPNDTLKPQEIDLWCNRQTGVVEMMKVQWGDNSRFGKLLVHLRLTALPRDLPADWYEHAHHHAANRLQIRRPARTNDVGPPP